jgi:hypothetical protein
LGSFGPSSGPVGPSLGPFGYHRATYIVPAMPMPTARP